jgi:hypothetical protein
MDALSLFFFETQDCARQTNCGSEEELQFARRELNSYVHGGAERMRMCMCASRG